MTYVIEHIILDYGARGLVIQHYPSAVSTGNQPEGMVNMVVSNNIASLKLYKFSSYHVLGKVHDSSISVWKLYIYYSADEKIIMINKINMKVLMKIGSIFGRIS